MQPSIGPKVCNLLGDERMNLHAPEGPSFKCDCGTAYDRFATHRKELTGFTCSYCQRKWKTHAPIGKKGQTQLWFKYYSCTCGSHPLNIPPKLTTCICEVGELR